MPAPSFGQLVCAPQIKTVRVVSVETTEEKRAALDDGVLTLHANLTDITSGKFSWRDVEAFLLANGGLKEQKEVER